MFIILAGTVAHNATARTLQEALQEAKICGLLAEKYSHQYIALESSIPEGKKPSTEQQIALDVLGKEWSLARRAQKQIIESARLQFTINSSLKL